jgi:hypothetical protein
LGWRRRLNTDGLRFFYGARLSLLDRGTDQAAVLCPVAALPIEGYFSTRFTAGGFQVPFKIDESFSFGQLAAITRSR